MDRRGFLRAGLLGTAALSTISLGASLSGCATTPAGTVAHASGATAEYRFLTRDDLVLLRALVPVIVAPGLPQDPTARQAAIDGTIARMDQGIYFFGPANQHELRKLFDLLNFSVTRVTLARVWSSWDNASPEAVNAFLNRWRDSNIGLFNKAYIGLTKLTNVSFYGYRTNWHLSGYPGPPQPELQTLPQFQAS
ncbi:hypothetical protein [Mangrovitalea sediminis]|uniref:hypothetical protein n=1 Tax=Mangrovitalea sediminis TaxID=1982043 RepID=UPI001D0D7F13|nr:hypothetical protein [Mangrovitalea sediminis]